MGSTCFGEYWDGTADSECREGEGCSKINECLAAFATGTLAKHQAELGPKKATPEELAELTSVRPEAILLAINFQHNTEFNPYGEELGKETVKKAQRKKINSDQMVREELKREAEREKSEEDERQWRKYEEGEEQRMEEVAQRELAEELEESLEENLGKKGKGSGAVRGAQFCEKCRGTGKRGRGVCRACEGTGKGKTKSEVDSKPEVAESVGAREEEKSVNREVATGDEISKGVEGADTHSVSALGPLPVSGPGIPDAVLDSSADNGNEIVARTAEPQDRQSLSQFTTAHYDERPKVFSPTLPDKKFQGNGSKKQVVVDMYNKRTVGVTWPGYPTLMETPTEKIVQIIAWDTTRQGWVRLVPQLSGDPDELLYSSLFQG